MNEIKGVITVNADSFQKIISESKVPVLVDFYADWCGPCKMMAPVMEKLGTEYAGKAMFLKLDIDREQQVAADYHVMSIPNFIIFKDGKAIENIVGAVPESQIVHLLEKAGVK